MERQVNVLISTKVGDFKMIVYSNSADDIKPHFALVHPDYNIDQPVLVRIHSECLTGDLLGSTRCDCGAQLHHAIQLIAEHRGVLLYMRQEGRGIGLINKLKAYQLQQEGLNTIDANVHLGFQPDERDYQKAIFILKDLGLKKIKLITNNPSKLTAIDRSDIDLIERIPLNPVSTSENEDYLQVKKELMGHLF